MSATMERRESAEDVTTPCAWRDCDRPGLFGSAGMAASVALCHGHDRLVSGKSSVDWYLGQVPGARLEHTHGWTYVIQGVESYRIKIGFTGRLFRRFDELLTGSRADCFGEQFNVLAVALGGRSRESQLHQDFWEYRLPSAGEVFRPALPILEYARVAGVHPDAVPEVMAHIRAKHPSHPAPLPRPVYPVTRRLDWDSGSRHIAEFVISECQGQTRTRVAKSIVEYLRGATMPDLAGRSASYWNEALRDGFGPGAFVHQDGKGRWVAGKAAGAMAA